MKGKETRGTFVSESKNKWRKKRKGRKQNSTTRKDVTYYLLLPAFISDSSNLAPNMPTIDLGRCFEEEEEELTEEETEEAVKELGAALGT